MLVSKRLPVEDSHIKGTSVFIVPVNFGAKRCSGTYVAPRSVSLKRFIASALRYLSGFQTDEF